MKKLSVTASYALKGGRIVDPKTGLVEKPADIKR